MQELNGKTLSSQWWRRIPVAARYVLVFLAILFILWSAIRLTNLITAWTLYSWFFEKIHTVGALPDYVSGAVAVWCVAAVVLFTPALFFSIFLKRSRKTVLVAAAGVSLWMMLYVLSIRQSGNLFNPITGTANYNYDRDSEGNIKLYDRGYSFNPATGEKLGPLEGSVAAEYLKQQRVAQARAEKEALEKQAQAEKAAAAERLRQQIAQKRAEKEALEKQVQAPTGGTQTPAESGALTAAAPSQTPAPTHAPARPLSCFSPTSGKDSDYYDVQLCECTRPRTSDRVSCSGFITNARSRDSQRLWVSDSLATDNDEGIATQVFTFYGDFGFCGTGSSADLAPGTRTRFCLRFRNTNPNVTTFDFTVRFQTGDGATHPTYNFARIPVTSIQ